MKLCTGDTVIVTTGKDKGKKGTIMRVLLEQHRVIVSGINMATKHIKKTAQGAGKKIRFEVAIHASNVMVIDPKSGKPTRIGYKVDPATGKKVRIAKKTGAILTRTKLPKAAKEAAGTPKEIKKEKEKDLKQPTKKSPFWKKVGFGADALSEEETSKADAGPSQKTVTHTRSAGRGA